MLRAPLAALALVVLTGCPGYESVSFRIDLEAKTIEVVGRNIVSDDPSEVEADFATVARSVHEPDDEEGLSNIEAEMRAENGELVVYWSASFDNLAAVDVYKHDRKAPYIWCPDGGEVSSETGTVPKELHGCVVFDRKAKVLEWTVAYDVTGSVSLLPQFEARQD